MPNVSFRPARVFAMQLLYSMELTGQTVGEALPGVLESQPISDEQKKYGMKLVDLVLAHREELDDEIKSATVHWEIERMACIDRIVIRITDTPIKVVLSEAIQISGKFSTEDSGSFVNGLLTGFMQKRNIVAGPTKGGK